MYAAIQKSPIRSSRHRSRVRQRVPRDVRAIGQRSHTTAIPMLQKSPCACGGSCPKCQAEQDIQPKLKIGAPNDKYEQEADRVADTVMRMPDPQVQRQPMEEDEAIQTKPQGTYLQRQEMEEEEEELQTKRQEGVIQRQAEGEEEEEEELQTKAQPGHTPTVGPTTHARIQSLKGGGQPLPRDTRTFFESRMGRDFGGVRIHTDNKAADTAQSVQAKAFTLGNNIVFNTGQYSPNNQEGKKLLAHELTHVVQQNANGGGLSPQARARVSSSSDPAEVVADHVASRVMQGKSTNLLPIGLSSLACIIRRAPVGQSKPTPAIKEVLQKKLDLNMKQIRNNKRQALDNVRLNLRRIGRILFLMHFAKENNFPLQRSEEITSLNRRVLEDDMASAAVGAGVTDKVDSFIKCEVARGYNGIQNQLKKKYPGKYPPAKEAKKECRIVDQWDKERKQSTKELRGYMPD